VAGQKGTTASVGNLFNRLPVRRRELEKNIKREYGKVLNLLHAYACISVGVRFNVKNTVGKTKNVVVFATKANPTTKENIANVYGAKTLLALIPLDLVLGFEPSTVGRRVDREPNKIYVRGHVSRPVFGEGRQTPDRQIFFVNSRPCGLPQIAKAFNEVYKSFNVSQSPFVFADFQMDTNAYDVNVSPDKRTILLHDSAALIESLKEELQKLFENAEQTVPQSQIGGGRHQPGIKGHLQTKRAPEIRAELQPSPGENETDAGGVDNQRSPSPPGADNPKAGEHVSSDPITENSGENGTESVVQGTHVEDNTHVKHAQPEEDYMDRSRARFARSEDEVPHRETEPQSSPSRPVEERDLITQEVVSNDKQNVIQNAFDRIRPRRQPAEIATITIGDKTVTSVIGNGPPLRKRNSTSAGFAAAEKKKQSKRRIHTPSRPNIFGQDLKSFAAPGTQIDGEDEEDDEEITGSDEEEETYSEVSESQDSLEEPDDASQLVAVDSIEPASQVPTESQELGDSSDSSDEDYIDEAEKKAQDEAKVQELIQDAEEKAVLNEHHAHRATNLTKGNQSRRDSTAHLVGKINGSLSRIEAQIVTLRKNLQSYSASSTTEDNGGLFSAPESSEERLSLTVSKDDFAKMRVVGQFNLGFILATRSPEETTHDQTATTTKDELFIIDQHASDEKYNFERLQTETVVQNQRLVRPKTLDLTAVEEEVIIENQSALEKNGFMVDVDESGNEAIGRRCKLVSLPLTKEVVFDVRDLEELIVLLSDSPTRIPDGPTSDLHIPRPSKVRKMFAMRACRSSIMIGKTLTAKQMEKVVRHMGQIDKPWNCPHGRPTMRHLMSLGQWNEYDEFTTQRGDESIGLDAWKHYFDWQAHGEEEQEEEVEDL
jgi:DNA mismatch repair protein PMS2